MEKAETAAEAVPPLLFSVRAELVLATNTNALAAPPPRLTVAALYTNGEEEAYAWLKAHAAAAVAPPPDPPDETEERPRKRRRRREAGGAAAVLGFDCEWPPTWRKGERPRVGTLQLATETHALVVQLSALRRAGRESPARGCLERILGSPAGVGGATLVGMGVASDVKVAREALGVDASAARPYVVDLKTFGSVRGVDVPGGLAGLTEHLCGTPSWKSQRVVMSDWCAAPLSEEQRRYAALDAWASAACFFKLRGLPIGARLAQAGARATR